MFSRWSYILIGNNNTGKTSFQREMVGHLCDEHYTRLPRNVVKTIAHPRAPQSLKTIFTSNRSYQEKTSEYKSVENYFANFFKEADIVFLSSHSYGSSINDVQKMISELHSRCYNVAGVFWSNDYGASAKDISGLPWQERLFIDNPQLKDLSKVPQQISRLAKEFSELIISRSYTQ